MDYLKKNKIKSFTMMEVIVTMIISSILVLLSINLYLNTQKDIDRYLSSSNEYNNSLFFINRLKIDVENSLYIKNTNSGFEITNFDSYISYSIVSNNIIRDSDTNKDTLSINTIDFYTENLNLEDNYVNKIVLQVNLDNKSTEIIINKEYTNVDMYRFSINEY